MRFRRILVLTLLILTGQFHLFSTPDNSDVERVHSEILDNMNSGFSISLPRIALPEAMGKVLFYLIIAAAGISLILLLKGVVSGVNVATEYVDSGEPGSRIDMAIDTSLPSSHLLRQSAALSATDSSKAILLLHKASIVRLVEDGIIFRKEELTNYEIAARLSSNPGRKSAFSSIALMAELIVFKHERFEPSVYHQLAGDYRREFP